MKPALLSAYVEMISRLVWTVLYYPVQPLHASRVDVISRQQSLGGEFLPDVGKVQIHLSY